MKSIQLKRFYILISSSLLVFFINAQTKKYQGQPPITIVSTKSKPVKRSCLIRNVLTSFS